MLRIFGLLAVLLTLAACGGGQKGPIPLDRGQSVAFAEDGPPKITLITVINNRTGQGGHTALMVSGSQRVIFDPAGSFRPDYVTEYGDVLYGITPQMLWAYKSAHSRRSHHTVTQEIVVSPEVAEQALFLVQAQGNVASAFCANSTSSILQQLPGFEGTDVTFLPARLMEQIATRSDVVTDRYFEDDDGNVLDGIQDLGTF